MTIVEAVEKYGVGLVKKYIETGIPLEILSKRESEAASLGEVLTYA